MKYVRLLQCFIAMIFLAVTTPGITEVSVKAARVGFLGHQAGIAVDDVIERWSYSDQRGSAANPYDLWRLESLQAPLTPVTLHLQRNSGPATVILTSDEWGLEFSLITADGRSPNLMAAEALADGDTAGSLAWLLEAEESADNTLAERALASTTDDHVLRVWTLLEANSLESKGHAEALGLALEITTETNPLLESSVRAALAVAAWRRLILMRRGCAPLKLPPNHHLAAYQAGAPSFGAPGR